MRITGARISLGPDRAECRDISIRGGRVFFDPAQLEEPAIDLNGFLLMPGLINGHDHLEFNLFPRLGGSSYSNAAAWAREIYKPDDSPVREHLAVSKRDRLRWGGLKNLLSGVTTVAHHNPLDDPVFGCDFPVRVVKQLGWAHSLDFSADLPARFRSTPPEWPFLVHAAEGTDDAARAEIATLDALGILCERTGLIHAIGLDHPGLELVKARRSGIVWCPSSNLSVYGRTLGGDVLGSGVNIALGTDSAMTAQVDLLDEIGVARRNSRLEPDAVYEMVTTGAARLLRLRDGQGEIRDEGIADLIAIRDRGQTPAAVLSAAAIPELVMVGGAIHLVSSALLERMPEWREHAPHSVELEARGRWFTNVDVASLCQETHRALGADFRLAGKRVSP